MSTIQLQVANPPSAADWLTSSVTATTIPLINKPTIPTTVDYTAASSSGSSLAIVNKPTIPTTVDYTAASSSGSSLAIVNKPTIPSSFSGLNNDTLAVTGSSILGGGLVVTGRDGATDLFPPPMTANITQGYIASASGVLTNPGNAAFLAFDRNVNTRWISPIAYDASGVYIGSTQTPMLNSVEPVHAGEWVQIQSPEPWRPERFTMDDPGARTKQYTMAGSIDGDTWYKIASNTLGAPIPAATGVAVTSGPNVPRAFTYFRFIVRALFPSQNGSTDGPNLLFRGWPYAATDLTVKGNITATGNLTALGKVTLAPGYWKYNLTTSHALSAGVATRPPLSSWTLSNPTSSGNIMDSTGQLVIPATGVYAVTLVYYFNTASGLQVWMPTTDASLGTIIFSSGQSTQVVNQMTWVGRIPSGCTLTPAYQSGVNNTLIAETPNSRQLNALTITQLYACN